MSTYSTVTTSTLDGMLSTYYDRNLMATIEKVERFAQFAEERPLPKGEGTGVVFNAWRNLTAVSSALTEATAPNAENLSSRKITATVIQYGKLVKISDFIDLTAISSPVKGALGRLGYWGGQALDRVCQKAIYLDSLTLNATQGSMLSALASATASSFCTNTGTGGSNTTGFPAIIASSATRVSACDGTSANSNAGMTSINLAVRALEELDAPKFNDGYYVGICRSGFKNDLMSDARFEGIHKYVVTSGGGVENLYKGEIGRINGVRFVVSNEVPYYYSTTAATSSDLTFIFGSGAYSVTKLDGGIKTYRVEKADHTNPLAQYKQIGVKFNAVAAALNPSCGRILITQRRG